ncbi:hypothetical protein GTZ89_02660 [Streptomyces sp. SID8382]|uniref:hypothetical protein n=1 Tax=Streptomyces malaysiensis TaxID=92644 RepID=UPI000C2BB14E|nr:MULTISPECIES: hypothetical protein [unclassified Streptomyces]AUA14986.1 hypothetical protein CFP59_07170 [Streptomyces sp. M56]MYX54657.1 hypothetical protein [Streptomyces sp. SID8382]
MTDHLTQNELRLTPHPLQRAGAYAIAAIAKAAHPEKVTGEQFDQVVQRMISDLVATSTVAKGQAGWYLLGISYTLWPNCALHYKSKRTPEGIAAWRSVPPAQAWPGVPCSLCGRPACDWYGNVDIPLGASVEHRNTTAPDHQGTPLCFPCVTSFHALPYAFTAGGGVLYGVHSWDERFMARATSAAVPGNQRHMMVRGDLKKDAGAFPVEFAALRALRWWDKRITAGVQAIQFSNSTRDMKFRVEDMGQPLAEWLRSTASDTHRRAGFRFLARAQATAKVSGLRMLAWRAFNQPGQIPSRASGWLRDQITETGRIPAAVPHLAPLIRTYLTEVLHVLEKDVGHVTTIARRIADVVTADDDKRLKKFVVATRRPNDLKGWLRSQIADWAKKRPAEAANEPFITVPQWRVLFDSGNTSWSARELLFVAVFEDLCARGATVTATDEATTDEDFTTLDTNDQEESD